MTKRHPLQTTTVVVGATFLVVGVLGFIPGITTDYPELAFAGHQSEAKLLGLFQISVLHNVVHVLFGVAGVVAARTSSAARAFLIGGGVIYLVLTVYGAVVDYDSAANFVPLNTADNALHLGLGLGMIAIGAVLGKRATTAV